MEKPNDVGHILKTERERLGLTLDVIQEATKIPIDSLKAIEEGYKIRTLTAFYYKSFVKLYAQHLGLDPQPILSLIPSYQAVKKVAAAENSVLEKPDLRKINITTGPMKTSSWKKFVPFVLSLMAFILIGWGVFALIRGVAGKISTMSHKVEPLPVKETSRSGKSAKGQKVSKVEKPVHIEKAEKNEKVEQNNKVEKAVKAVNVESPVASVEPVVEQKRTVSQVNEVGDAKPVKKVSLTVRATVTAWLTVKSDGSVVFKGSLKKGSAESWTAAKKIEISGKEVDNLEYEVNGKTIGKLGNRDIKARRVVITPEGLSVEK